MRGEVQADGCGEGDERGGDVADRAECGLEQWKK